MGRSRYGSSTSSSRNSRNGYYLRNSDGSITTQRNNTTGSSGNVRPEGSSDYFSQFDSSFNPFLSWLYSMTGAGLTAAQVASMRFSHDEAELARDWDEEMYNRYNSPSALMAQYRDAGLNPALMYGQQVSGNMSSNGPVASNTVSASQGPNFGDLLQMFGLKSQIELNKANARLANSNARLQDIEAKWRDHILDLTSQGQELANKLTGEQIRKTAFEVFKIDAEKLLTEAQTTNEELRKYVIRADAWLKDAMRKHEDETVKQIATLTPVLEDLYKKQGSNQEAQAAYALAQTAIQNGLLDAGYIKEYVESIAAKGDLDVSQTQLNDFINGLQGGNFFPDDMLGSKFMNSFVQGMMMFSKLFPKIM